MFYDFNNSIITIAYKYLYKTFYSFTYNSVRGCFDGKEGNKNPEYSCINIIGT